MRNGTDRSVIVSLRRKMAGESVQRLTIDFKEDQELIRKKLVKWAKVNFKHLKHNPVEPPEIQNDRAMDNWLPLFTVAGAIGGDWPEKVESSYIILNSMKEEETAAIMHLTQLRDFMCKNSLFLQKYRDRKYFSFKYQCYIFFIRNVVP